MSLEPSRARRALVAAHLLLIVLPAAAATAAEPWRPIRVSVPPVLDGRLDDEAWHAAPTVTGFKTWLPDFGVTMADQTTVYMAYDAENLYFAFRAADREPSKIKASMASRDSIRPDDWVCINLDSFNDQQALYGFYVNPLGVQMDSRFALGREDMGFDAVWYSAGRIDDQGYAVEVRIPFKSLRYSGGSPITMGVIFERFVSRRNEDGTVPPLDPRAGLNFLIQMAPIEFRDVKHYTLLEVLPAATYSRQQVATTGALATESAGGDLGVTAKYGLTAQLTVDGTYNPDFSQVESDAGQIDVNLRAPLFFAEKRPFFLEGQEVFTLGGPSQTGALQTVVHTRNIVDPRAGLKVTGKLAAADTLSALYAADESSARADGSDTHFTILRYKRALQQDSYLGGIYAGQEHGSLHNRVGGVDGSLRVDRASAIGFHVLGSTTRREWGGASSVGHAIGAEYQRETRRLAARVAAYDISTAFAADSGYLTRNGILVFSAAVGPRLYPTGGWVQRVDLSAATEQTRDSYSGIWETRNEAGLALRLQRAATVSLTWRHSTEVFEGEEFSTSGVSAQAAMQVSKQLRVEGSASQGRAIYYDRDPFGGRSIRAVVGLVYQPSEQWSQAITASYANFDRASDDSRLYDYTILRSRTSFQVNRFLFFRGIVEYNSFRRQLVTDLLASFTYIPGTVLHVGYGSLYEKTRWDGLEYVRDRSFQEIRRGVFLKASYLWRL